ncbi:uracil phosphoribosyltransferase, partial [Acinetobacter nosocomialis]|uniref:uracil phosphoribosyltransferase n=1 Tax=Acinetobacter nosocomialis TaxID=106654 RepID=UPI0027E4FD2B
EVRTYYKKLVPDVANRIAMIIDPMLATGNSLVAAIDVLKASGLFLGILLARSIAGLLSTVWSWHAVYLISGIVILMFAWVMW